MDVLVTCTNCDAEHWAPMGTGFELDHDYYDCPNPHELVQAVSLGYGNEVVGWGDGPTFDGRNVHKASDVELLVDLVLGDADAQRRCLECDEWHEVPICDREYEFVVVPVPADTYEGETQGVSP